MNLFNIALFKYPAPDFNIFTFYTDIFPGSSSASDYIVCTSILIDFWFQFITRIALLLSITESIALNTSFMLNNRKLLSISFNKTLTQLIHLD